MREIVDEDQPFVREDVSTEEALGRLTEQPFKREIVEGLGTEAAAGEIDAAAETASFYRNDGWEDLCLGPHVPSTGRLGAFKLTAVSGAYWRGDEHNPQLTRIYGTAWATDADLEAYLRRSRRPRSGTTASSAPTSTCSRSPRRSARASRCSTRAAASSGMIMEDYSRRRHEEAGYEFVNSPHITKRELFETSAGTSTGTPTACSRRWSSTAAPTVLPQADELSVPHPDLPVAARGPTASCRCGCSSSASVYRYEKSGVVHGLTRVRG